MGHNFGEEQGEFFFGNSAFSSRFLLLCIPFWWERLPWISVVVPMKKLKGGEGEKVMEEWAVVSHAGSSSSKGKER